MIKAQKWSRTCAVRGWQPRALAASLTCRRSTLCRVKRNSRRVYPAAITRCRGNARNQGQAAACPRSSALTNTRRVVRLYAPITGQILPIFAQGAFVKILVTPRSFGKTNPELFDRLAQAGLEVIRNDTGGILSAEQMKEKLANCAGVILGVDPMNRRCSGGGPQPQDHCQIRRGPRQYRP